jgi:hypothetical protein
MKTIDLDKQATDLDSVLGMASVEPLLIVTADGRRYCLAEADDFDQEVAALRASPAFQRFLDERHQSQTRVSLDDVEAEIDRELAG